MAIYSATSAVTEATQLSLVGTTHRMLLPTMPDFERLQRSFTNFLTGVELRCDEPAIAARLKSACQLLSGEGEGAHLVTPYQTIGLIRRLVHDHIRADVRHLRQNSAAEDYHELKQVLTVLRGNTGPKIATDNLNELPLAIGPQFAASLMDYFRVKLGTKELSFQLPSGLSFDKACGWLAMTCEVVGRSFSPFLSRSDLAALERHAGKPAGSVVRYTVHRGNNNMGRGAFEHDIGVLNQGGYVLCEQAPAQFVALLGYLLHGRRFFAPEVPVVQPMQDSLSAGDYKYRAIRFNELGISSFFDHTIGVKGCPIGMKKETL